MSGPVSGVFTLQMSGAWVEGCAGAGAAESKPVCHRAVCGVISGISEVMRSLRSEGLAIGEVLTEEVSFEFCS